MFKNALVSCSDKKDLVEFLKPLQAKGLRIVSTGGTAKHLRDNGLTVIDVSEQTDFEEVMDGRVKTLHPKVHMPLLARIDDPSDLEILKKYKVEPFDLVIGNLYPFEAAPSIDTIDIGGPSFLRSAAKSFSRIAVICDPTDYAWVLEKGSLDLSDRQKLAAKVFAHTSTYDSMIAKHFAKETRLDFNDLSLGGKYVQALRYGENSQQRAVWYRTGGEENGIHRAQILQGKELSYNNLLDIEAAVSTVRDLSEAKSCVAVKHNSPCGVASHAEAEVAVANCLLADPQSVFGGIVATNFAINANMALTLSSIFLECIVAPHFEEGAIEIFRNKKNLRLLQWPDFHKMGDNFLYRSVSGGFLVQTKDQVAATWDESWSVQGATLDQDLMADLLVAWKICAHLKSNAISIVSKGQTVGLGMGQVNRVDAVEQAIQRMKRFHNDCKSPVLASDAFFPFADSIEKIANAGIRYLIQPGGSVKDEEVRAKARELDVTMVFTGQRHFLH
ncbi:MAG: bifunctional phosphoribosylaminoimidazolecarboxamide formyltransferase/IMP cyclohydrolase [Bdellovibrionales bacterium]|nr:bifunctional phosphoribosylaminoimidazolecarboxamide formyltransferase/IMP cyclohydrolase [Bdellovibrionales bacterium]